MWWRNVTLVYAVVFTAVGLAGFIPALLSPPADPAGLAVDSFHGHLLGLFPVNVLHNLVHILFGVWGLLAARSPGGAIAYARAVAVIYALLTVMGLIPALNLHTTFGLVPLYGHDIWLHALLAAVAAYFGFVHRGASTATAR